MKFVYKEGKHAITAIAFDEQSETAMAGTHASHVI